EQQTKALRESEARYRGLFDHNPNMAFIVDRSGAIIRANSCAERQMAMGDLVGRDLGTFFPGEVRERLAWLSEQVQGMLLEQPMNFGDGEHIVDIDISAIPGFDHLQVVIRDVTARLDLARELQQTRRLAAIGQLAAGVAHEINNPLAVLQLGLAELLGEHGSRGGPRQTRLLELVAHGERIARIV
ncbi:MAG: PAS domain S-box protein, partial [Myxococcales bacterium]|nr:PAS domain S-box protein [Myxococcales bacterium]